jgi:hypothetical protein
MKTPPTRANDKAGSAAYGRALRRRTAPWTSMLRRTERLLRCGCLLLWRPEIPRRSPNRLRPLGQSALPQHHLASQRRGRRCNPPCQPMRPSAMLTSGIWPNNRRPFVFRTAPSTNKPPAYDNDWWRLCRPRSGALAVLSSASMYLSSKTDLPEACCCGDVQARALSPERVHLLRRRWKASLAAMRAHGLDYHGTWSGQPVDLRRGGATQSPIVADWHLLSSMFLAGHPSLNLKFDHVHCQCSRCRSNPPGIPGERRNLCCARVAPVLPRNNQ